TGGFFQIKLCGNRNNKHINFLAGSPGYKSLKNNFLVFVGFLRHRETVNFAVPAVIVMCFIWDFSAFQQTHRICFYLFHTQYSFSVSIYMRKMAYSHLVLSYSRKKRSTSIRAAAAAVYDACRQTPVNGKSLSVTTFFQLQTTAK